MVQGQSSARLVNQKLAAAEAAAREAACVEAARRAQQHAEESFTLILGFLDPPGPGGGFLSFGLAVADCARLASASKECRDAVAASTCWRVALAALEQDFPFVPDNGDDSLPKSLWRQALGDPRYEAAGWAAALPMRRFGDLLEFAQMTVDVLREFPADADKDWWHYELDGHDFASDHNPPALMHTARTPHSQNLPNLLLSACREPNSLTTLFQLTSWYLV